MTIVLWGHEQSEQDALEATLALAALKGSAGH